VNAMRHTIRINQVAAGKYSVVGSGISITSSPTPVPDAAAALRAAGADDSDLIVATCGDCSILPASIGSILNFRHTPRRQEFLRDLVGISPATR
jgi:hypothetical protein